MAAERAGHSRACERRHMSCWLGAPARIARRGKPAPAGGAEGLALAAERLLLEGKPRDALSTLSRAVAADARSPWSYVYRAAAGFRLGDWAAAQADAQALAEGWPGLACGPAILALLRAAQGDRPGAERWLEAAAKLGPDPWLLGLRGTLRSRWGQHDGARADLDVAVKAEPSAWILMARAELLNRMGLFWLALKDLDRARCLMPGEAEPDLRAAAFHLDQAQYAQAKRRLTRVLSLRPLDQDVWARRAQICTVEGDLRGALADMRRACRLAPADQRLIEGRLRLEIMLGRYPLALRSVRSLPRAAREHWLGYMRCRQGRYAESRRHFETAARLDPRRESSAFYVQVAKSMAQAPAAPRCVPGKTLTIMGLGYRQPFQVSREALFALRDCEVLYSNLSDSAVADFLGLFPAPFRAIVFRRSDQQSTRCARDVMPAFKTRRRVGVVTRGHPLYYGRLAYRLVRDCRRLGVAVRVPGSVSLSDTIVSLADHAREEELGLQVRNSSFMAGLDLRLPLVLYNFAGVGQWRATLSSELARRYPRGHSCILLPGSGDREFTPSAVPVEALGPALAHADEAVTLLLPAVGSRRGGA